jgi:hypothetical protein
MGYIKSVVNTGMEYAEKYRVPELVSKARSTSTTVDMTVGKLDTLILTPLVAKGAPLVETLDTQLDSRVAQAKGLPAKAKGFAQEKLTVMTEFKDEKTALVKGTVLDTKDKLREKAEETKGKLREKAEETKGKLREKAEETKGMLLEKAEETRGKLQGVQATAISSKAFAETKLLGGAQEVDRRLGRPYAGQAASLAVRTADRALAYSTETAQLLLTKTLAMPLTLKERMEQGQALATETAGKAKALVTGAQSKALVLLLAAKVQFFALPPAIFATKDGLQASFQNGTLSQDAKDQYARALKFVQAQALYAQTWLPTAAKVAPYLEQAKQGVAVAKAEALKLQDAAKRRALYEQGVARATSAARATLAAALRLVKAKAA